MLAARGSRDEPDYRSRQTVPQGHVPVMLPVVLKFGGKSTRIEIVARRKFR
jgi:hypothetical protein